MPGKRIRPYVDLGFNTKVTKRESLLETLRETKSTSERLEITSRIPSRGIIKVCCAGLNPEEAMLEAIITVNASGFLPDLTSLGALLIVAFSVDIEGETIECGTTRINVFNPLDMPSRNYAVRKVLSPDCAAKVFASGPTVGERTLNCIAFLASNPLDIDSLESPIPFPQWSYWGRWKLLRRNPEVDDFAGRAFPVHAAALKNGQVLFFAGGGNDDFAIFDPDTDSIQMALPGSHRIETWLEYQDSIEVTIEENGVARREPLDLPPDTATTKFSYRQQAIALSHAMFCSGHTLLSDGSLLVVGGYTPVGVGPDHYHRDHPIGARDVSLYQTDTATWESITPIRHARWYPTTVIMGDGNVFVMEGHPDSDDPLLAYDHDHRRHTNNDREIYLAQTRNWQYEPMANASMVKEGLFGEYPRLHLLPDGNLLCTSKIFVLPPEETIGIENNQFVRTVTPAQEFDFGITAIFETNTKSWKKIFEFEDEDRSGANISSASILLPLTYPFGLAPIC